MIAFIWYISLLLFSINGLIFIGHYNRDKYSRLVVLEYVRSKNPRRRRRR